MKLYITSGASDLMSESERMRAEKFVSYMRENMLGTYQIEECTLHRDSIGFTWEEPKEVAAEPAILVLALFSTSPEHIRYEVRRFNGDGELKDPQVAVIALGAQILMSGENNDYSRVCIGLRSDMYEYKNWPFASFEEGFVLICDFLRRKNLPIPE